MYCSFPVQQLVYMRCYFLLRFLILCWWRPPFFKFLFNIQELEANIHFNQISQFYYYTKNYYAPILRFSMHFQTWWASKSTIMILLMLSVDLNKFSTKRVISAYGQKPPPWSRLQWWKPPPRLIAQPRFTANWPARTLPLVWYLRSQASV